MASKKIPHILANTNHRVTTNEGQNNKNVISSEKPVPELTHFMLVLKRYTISCETTDLKMHETIYRAYLYQCMVQSENCFKDNTVFISAG